MAQTFEELTASELDALYQGALFLSGGIPTEAERLLAPRESCRGGPSHRCRRR